MIYLVPFCYEYFEKVIRNIGTNTTVIHLLIDIRVIIDRQEYDSKDNFPYL